MDYEHIPSSSSQNTHPFHGVSRGDLTEHRVVVEDSSVCSVRQLAVVRGSTEVELVHRLGQLVELGGRGRRATARGGGMRYRSWRCVWCGRDRRGLALWEAVRSGLMQEIAGDVQMGCTASSTRCTPGRRCQPCRSLGQSSQRHHLCREAISNSLSSRTSTVDLHWPQTDD